jgi:tetratricopeptide (TPR) repeat protein
VPRYALALLAAAATTAAAADPPAGDLVRDLGSPSFAARERATRDLWRLGAKARPAVEAAAASPDPEVRRRAAVVLDRFDWGILPDTPANVLALIREFRTGQPEKQTRALDGLLAIGDRGLDAIALILARDFDADRGAALFAHYHRQARRVVPAAVLDGNLDRAGRILETAALGGVDGGWADYALFMHLRGKLPEAAGRLEALRSRGGARGQSAGYTLVWAHHLAGRTDDAIRVAGSYPEEPAVSNLLTSVREDAGRWAELADGPTHSRGLALFRARMAGRDAAVAEHVTELLKPLHGFAPPDEVRQSATDLLLNGETAPAIRLLKAKPVRPELLADLLAARGEFAAALELLSKGDAPGAVRDEDPRPAVHPFRRGRLLAQLGRHAEAGRVFEAAAGGLRRTDPGTQVAIVQLIMDEVRAGRRDQAADHVARFLDQFERMDEGFHARPSPFELVFEDDADAARGWWRALRKFGPKEPPADTMRRVRERLAGTASAERAADADRAVGLWEDSVRRSDYPNQGELLLVAQARAAAAIAEGKLAEAEKHLTAAATASAALAAGGDDDDPPATGTGVRGWEFGTDERFRAWLDLGDFLADRGRPREAAAKYLDGWRAFPDNPILLYLSGRALVAAGDTAEGERRVAAAHWVPLGNARMRGRFLAELCGRGRPADLRRERDLARRCVWYWAEEPGRGNVWHQVVRASAQLGEYEAAAAATERYLNYILRTDGVYFVNGTAYATVPASVVAHRARARLAAGRVDEGLALLREYRELLPGGVEATAGAVQELDRLGRRAEADAAFRAVWDVYARLIGEHTESGWARAAAAALAAGCRRELDAGLAHARKAVSLEPSVRGHREVLAEVLFRRGERAEALDLMRSLSKADPRNRQYRRQLARYETGDPASPPE